MFGEYSTNEEEEIIHDGALLTKAGITLGEIKKTITFDIIIETESNKKYETTVIKEVPVGNLVEDGIGTEDNTNFNHIRFKRI